MAKSKHTRRGKRPAKVWKSQSNTRKYGIQMRRDHELKTQISRNPLTGAMELITEWVRKVKEAV